MSNYILFKVNCYDHLSYIIWTKLARGSRVRYPLTIIFFGYIMKLSIQYTHAIIFVLKLFLQRIQNGNAKLDNYSN